jgi:hypothetical protein
MTPSITTLMSLRTWSSHFLKWKIFNEYAKNKLKLSHYTPRRRLGERMYSSYSFTSAVDWGEWSASRPGPRYSPRERTAGTHWTGGWVGPGAGLDTEVRGKILAPVPGIESRSPGRPVRSQTLYWLSYLDEYAAFVKDSFVCRPNLN